jgi:hypothetical protein
MFVALSGPPRILRLFGTGTFHELGTPEYAKYITPDLRTPGSRAVIVVDVHKVGSVRAHALVSTRPHAAEPAPQSCGYSIPRFAYASERDLLHRHALAKEQIDAAYDSERTTISPSSSSETLADPALSHSTSGMRAYWALKNAASIDGLPALSGAFRALPELPASAPALRVPLLDAKMGLQEAYETARARELASEDLPSVGAALSSAPTMMETPRAKERDHNMLIIGFVLGLIAAAVMDQLVVLVRRRASQALFL